MATMHDGVRILDSRLDRINKDIAAVVERLLAQDPGGYRALMSLVMCMIQLGLVRAQPHGEGGGPAILLEIDRVLDAMNPTREERRIAYARLLLSLAENEYIMAEKALLKKST